MHSSFHLGRRVAAALLLSSSIAVLTIPSVALARRPFERCQAAIAGGSTTLVTRQLGVLGRCVARALACVEATPDDPECLADAGEACNRALAKGDAREERLVRTVAARCRAVDPARLLAPTGLGFDRLAMVCPDVAAGAADAAAVAACVVAQARCQTQRLVAAGLPRAGELLRIVGVPTWRLQSLTCLADHGGSGEGDTANGAVILDCTRRTRRAADRFVGRMLANAGSCTRAALACLDDEVPGDETCRLRAAAACDRSFARETGARRALERALASACVGGADEFAAVGAPTGANLEALADVCASAGVDVLDGFPAYAACLGRETDCAVATLVELATPRLADVLALVGRPPTSACPAPAATATPTPSPSLRPTATVTGPTRTPRPGETATPTASPTPTLTASPTPTPSRTPRPTRTRTPTPQPTSTPFCGNGVIDDEEECDGSNLDDNTCEDLCEESDPQGVLKCTSSCGYDFRDCRGIGCEAL